VNSEWIKEISIEDLPPSYQEVARIVGVENAVKLSEQLGGLGFYFPKIDSLIQKKRDEKIRKEFSGCNHQELARKYGLSEIWIRNIVQNGESKKQTDLFAEKSKGI